jgi:hypothetical protein
MAHETRYSQPKMYADSPHVNFDDRLLTAERKIGPTKWEGSGATATDRRPQRRRRAAAPDVPAGCGRSVIGIACRSEVSVGIMFTIMMRGLEKGSNKRPYDERSRNYEPRRYQFTDIA